MDVIIKTSTEPPSHQRPVETLSENDINHDIEPAYHRMHASIVHPEGNLLFASSNAFHTFFYIFIIKRLVCMASCLFF